MAFSGALGVSSSAPPELTFFPVIQWAGVNNEHRAVFLDQENNLEIITAQGSTAHAVLAVSLPPREWPRRGFDNICRLGRADHCRAMWSMFQSFQPNWYGI
jgi:hypothetical protein